MGTCGVRTRGPGECAGTLDHSTPPVIREVRAVAKHRDIGTVSAVPHGRTPQHSGLTLLHSRPVIASRREFVESRVETLFWFACLAFALPLLILALASAAGCDVHGTPPAVSDRASSTAVNASPMSRSAIERERTNAPV